MSERPVGTQPGDLREAGLEQLRRDAELSGRVDRAGIRPRGAPFPQLPRASSETGYYGVPLLKAPAWTWEVPLYFFVGGVAGASAIVGSISRMTGAHPELVRDARALAAIGGTVSPALLIADLGMPSRFLHMLRVFKIQSPMSVGSWTLMVFSSSAAGLAFLDAVNVATSPPGTTGTRAFRPRSISSEMLRNLFPCSRGRCFQRIPGCLSARQRYLYGTATWRCFRFTLALPGWAARFRSWS